MSFRCVAETDDVSSNPNSTRALDRYLDAAVHALRSHRWNQILRDRPRGGVVNEEHVVFRRACFAETTDAPGKKLFHVVVSGSAERGHGIQTDVHDVVDAKPTKSSAPMTRCDEPGGWSDVHSMHGRAPLLHDVSVRRVEPHLDDGLAQRSFLEDPEERLFGMGFLPREDGEIRYLDSSTSSGSSEHEVQEPLAASASWRVQKEME